MKPIEILDGICRCYLYDFRLAVDQSLHAKINGYFRSRKYTELAACTRHFDSALHSIDEWRFLRQIEAFYKKNTLLAKPSVCTANAHTAFFEAERICSDTNRRLKPFACGAPLLEEPLAKQVADMQHFIRSVLGEFHTFIEELPSLVKVTPGATAHRKRKRSVPQMKMRPVTWCTKRSQKYVWSLYRYYGIERFRIKHCASNRVELVPKNWKTHRTVACEPEGNLPLQLAFDTYTKKRLRKFGIDLRDQSANQRCAKIGSIDGSLATVDFSRASDTIAYNTVMLLITDIDWLTYLDDVRSPLFRGAFGEGKYAKFSSMGNGATFTLETLIFAAACYAVGSKRFCVYGDDVIIETELFESYQSLTRFLGFSINTDKSFVSGPFRESCGKDYYDGVDVTPVYIRKLDERKATLCHVCNTIRGLAPYDGKLWLFLDSLIKVKKLPLVPFNESTISGIWIYPELARRLGILYRGKRGIDYMRAYAPRTKKLEYKGVQGYFLWHLNRNRQVTFSGPWGQPNLSSNETSWVAVYDHAYVRKRVSWHLPREGTSLLLYKHKDHVARC